MKKILLLLLLCVGAMGAWAQNDEKAEKAYALLGEGVNLHEEGKYEEAIKKYSEGLKLDPKNPNLYYEKAYTLREMDKKKEAKKVLLESLKKCSEEDAGSALAENYNLLATLVDDEGDSRQALEYYHKAMKLDDGQNSELAQNLFYNTGICYQRLAVLEPDSVDEYENRAMNCFTISLTYKPTHASSYIGFYNSMIDAGTPGGFSYALGMMGWYGFFGNDHRSISKLAEMPDKWLSFNFPQEVIDEWGPKTRASYESVREAASKEPSEYGKVYDVFMYAVPKVAENVTDEPVPLPLIKDDIHNEFLWPLYAKMIREGVFEAFCHVVGMRDEKYYIANANWITKNEEAANKLVKMMNDGRYFDAKILEEQTDGKVPSVAEVTSAEDAHARNEEARLACLFYLKHYLTADDMDKTAQFIFSWTQASPDVTIPIGEAEAKWMNEETAPYLVAFMASCSLYQLNNETNELPEDNYLAAVTDMLNYYSHNKETTGTNAELERLYNLGAEDYDAFEKEVRAGYPKAQ